MSNLAIIPARGGSKRIPRKNLKDFLGKPIISYSIETALKSKLFEEVMVSTDDPEIAETAIKFGAKVPFMRSRKASDDFATTMDVILEVTMEYNKQYNKQFNFICCIYPTAPLIKQHQLLQGEQLIKNSDFDTVFPVSSFTYPIWRGLDINETGEARFLWPENENKRTQDFKKVYHDAGQWYWFNYQKLREEKSFKKMGTIILSPDEVQDIDNLADWKLAELKFKFNSEK